MALQVGRLGFYDVEWKPKRMAKVTVESYETFESDPNLFLREYVSKQRPVKIVGVPVSGKGQDNTTNSVINGIITRQEFFEKRVTVAPQQPGKADKWIEQESFWSTAVDVSITKTESDGASTMLSPRSIIETERGRRERKVLAVAGRRLEMSWRDFLADIEQYYADGAGEKSLEFFQIELQKSLNTTQIEETLVNQMNLKNRDIWMGSVTKSALHYDNQDNLFFQLLGKKHFLLAPPLHQVTGMLQEENVDLVKRWYVLLLDDSVKSQKVGTDNFKREENGGEAALDEKTTTNYATWNFDECKDNKNVEEIKNFLYDRVFQHITVEPGEMLYIPVGWWHQVTTDRFMAISKGEKPSRDNKLNLSYTSFYQPYFIRFKKDQITRIGAEQNLSTEQQRRLRDMWMPNTVYKKLHEKYPPMSFQEQEDGQTGDEKSGLKSGSDKTENAKETKHSSKDSKPPKEIVDLLQMISKSGSGNSTGSASSSSSSPPPNSDSTGHIYEVFRNEFNVLIKENEKVSEFVNEKLEALWDEWYITSALARAGLSTRFEKEIRQKPECGRVLHWFLLRMCDRMWLHGITDRCTVPDNIPGTRSFPVWNNDSFKSWIADLQSSYQDVKSEIENIRGKGLFQPYRDQAPVSDKAADTEVKKDGSSAAGGNGSGEKILGAVATSSGAWNVLYIHIGGQKLESATQYLPKTVEVVEKKFPRHYSHAFVSALVPGSNIIPHFGPNNRMLRVWLPLCGCGDPEKTSDEIVNPRMVRVVQDNKIEEYLERRKTYENPEEEYVLESEKQSKYPIALQVSDYLVLPKNGQPFAWDHSYRHTAWNFSDMTRLVLIVDIWHPDLTDKEILVLSTMQKYRLKGGREIVKHYREKIERQKLEAEKENAVEGVEDKEDLAAIKQELDNNLFTILEQNASFLNEDDWWILRAENEGPKQSESMMNAA